MNGVLDGGREQGEQIERVMQARLAIHFQSVLEPLLEGRRRKALARVYEVLDAGNVPTAESALAVVLELYAIDTLARSLRKMARRGETIPGLPPPVTGSVTTAEDVQDAP